MSEISEAAPRPERPRRRRRNFLIRSNTRPFLGPTRRPAHRWKDLVERSRTESSLWQSHTDLLSRSRRRDLARAMDFHAPTFDGKSSRVLSYVDKQPHVPAQPDHSRKPMCAAVESSAPPARPGEAGPSEAPARRRRAPYDLQGRPEGLASRSNTPASTGNKLWPAAPESAALVVYYYNPKSALFCLPVATARPDLRITQWDELRVWDPGDG